MTIQPSILLIGIGNPGRQDDGLGPACAGRFEREDYTHLRVEANYQLAIEDAADIARHQTVIFIDAAVDGPEPFAFEPVAPGIKGSFTSHILEPETVMAAARDLFNAAPEAYTMRIRGYEFDEFGEDMSPRASQNLEAAVVFIRDFVISRQECCSQIHQENVKEPKCKTENM